MDTPLVVLITPLRSSDRLPGGGMPAAAMFLTDPERSCQGHQATLMRLYGLTSAEADVAVQVARGNGLQQAADSLSVSLNTVRTQLAQVMSKTCTRRQAELVRLVAGSVAQVRPRSRPAGGRRR